MTKVITGAVTDVGRVRTSNQDSYLVTEGVYVVADGMGGHAAGDLASRIAIDAIREAVDNDQIDTLVEAVKAANLRILEKALEDPALRGMGTTLTGLALVKIAGHERFAVVNVGDSRVYVVQDGELIQITRDHTFVGDLLIAGEITAEEARNHPRRNVITRALGIEHDVQVDVWEVTPYAGDRYLVCSDGLFGEVDDATIAEQLRAISDPNEAAKRLVDMACDAGGHDNVTVLVVDVVEGAPPIEAEPTDAAPTLIEEAPSPATLVDLPPPTVPTEHAFNWRTVLFVGVILVVLLLGAIGVIAAAS
jgi:PPM family protein phosphatase